jgi:hypothetical protein
LLPIGGLLRAGTARVAGRVEAEFDQARHGGLHALFGQGPGAVVRPIMHGRDHGTVTVRGVREKSVVVQHEP